MKQNAKAASGSLSRRLLSLMGDNIRIVYLINRPIANTEMLKIEIDGIEACITANYQRFSHRSGAKTRRCSD